MKKLFTLCIFALSMFFVTNGFSQNKIEINKVAAQNAETLRTQAKLSKEQREGAYQAFKTYQELIVQSTDKENNIHPKRKQVIEEKLQKELSKVLTPEQFENFLAIFHKEKLITL